MSIQDFKKRIPQVIFENPDELISGEEHQKLLLDGVDLFESELNKSELGLTEEISKKVDKTEYEADKKEIEDAVSELSDTKVDKKDYDADKEALEEFKQDQEEIDQKQDIEISKSNQELKVIKDTLKHLGSNDEIEVAKGSNIISLPNNAMKSVAPNYKFEGLTLNQLVKNGDFRDGKKNWKNFNSIFLIDDNNIAKLSVTDTYGNIAQMIRGQKKDDLLYINLYYETPVDGFAINQGNAQIIRLNKEGSNESWVIKSNGGTEFKIQFNKQLDNYDNIFMLVKAIYIVNISQTFGAGNEPTKEWCDEHIQGYFEGVKYVQTPMRIKSVGENLFNYGLVNINRSNLINVEGKDINIKKDNRLHISIFNTNRSGGGKLNKNDSLYLIPNLDYYFYFEGEGNVRMSLGVYGENNSVLMYDLIPYVYHKIPKSSNTMLDIRIQTAKSETKITNLSVSLNKSKLDYTESNLYINNQLELRSIGGAKDYIKDGKLYQNTKRYYFTKEDKWWFDGDYEGDNFRYYMTLPFDYKTTGANVENELLCNNFTPASNVASVLTERESNTIALYRENSSTVYLTLDKKVDNVNSVIPEGTFIDVILPQTEVSNLNTSGLIVNQPNGTIFIEPIANVTAYYIDGLDVSSINIEEVVKFSHMVDGVYEPLDVSKIEIKDNKLTHPEANNGLVYLVYRYDANPIFGNNEVSYYNNNRVLESPNGTFFKPVFSVDDEGNISMKGEKL